MKPPGLPFLFVLSLTVAGPSLLGGLPIVLLLYAGADAPLPAATGRQGVPIRGASPSFEQPRPDRAVHGGHAGSCGAARPVRPCPRACIRHASRMTK